MLGDDNHNDNALDSEDDWSKVEDPKERKRRQNRVAQRGYRRRLKQRIQGMEQRLNQADEQTADEIRGNEPIAVPNTHGINMNFGPRDQALLSSISGNTLFRSNLPETIHGARDSLDTSRSVTSNQSRPGTAELDGGGITSPETENSTTPESLIEVLQLQLRLLSYYQGLLPGQNSQEPRHSISDSLSSGRDFSAPSTNTSISQICDRLNIPPSIDMDYINHYSQSATAVRQNGWPSSNLMNETSLSSSPNDAINYFASLNTNTTNIDPEHSALAEPSSIQQPSSSSKPPIGETSWVRILEAIQAAGLDNLDDLFAAYYTQDFEEQSMLNGEQHMSRNRRLPQVISEISKSSSGWTSWERGGVQQQLLRAAEAVLVFEDQHSNDSHVVAAQSLLQSQPVNWPGSVIEVLQKFKRAIKVQRPNLWAMMTAVTTDQSAVSSYGNKYSKALAMALITELGGKVPKGQLLQMLDLCL